MDTKTIQGKVADLNKAKDEAARGPTLPKKAPSKKPVPDVNKMTLEYNVKGGIPQIPDCMIKIEVGKKDKPFTKDTGFESIAMARVYFGLPKPNGGFQIFAWQNYQVEVKGSKLRSISPFFIGSDKDQNNDANFMPTAWFAHPDRVARTIAKIIAAKKMRTWKELNEDMQRFQVVYTYDTNPQDQLYDLAE